LLFEELIDYLVVVWKQSGYSETQTVTENEVQLNIEILGQSNINWRDVQRKNVVNM